MSRPPSTAALLAFFWWSLAPGVARAAAPSPGAAASTVDPPTGSNAAPPVEPAPATLSAIHIRLSPATSHNWNVGWTWARLGLAFDLLERGTVEAGTSLTMSMFGPSLHVDAFVRGGLAWVVVDGRDAAGEGWTLQPLALLGYRFLPLADEGDGYAATQVNHCATFETGLAGTVWLTESAGLELHLSGGVWVPFHRVDGRNWNNPYVNGRHDDLYGDVTISLGLSLR